MVEELRTERNQVICKAKDVRMIINHILSYLWWFQMVPNAFIREDAMERCEYLHQDIPDECFFHFFFVAFRFELFELDRFSIQILNLNAVSALCSPLYLSQIEWKSQLVGSWSKDWSEKVGISLHIRGEHGKILQIDALEQMCSLQTRVSSVFRKIRK